VPSVWNRSSFVGKKLDCSQEFGTPDQTYNLQLVSDEALGSCPERLDQVQHHGEEWSWGHHHALYGVLRPVVQLEFQASEAAALA